MVSPSATHEGSKMSTTTIERPTSERPGADPSESKRERRRWLALAVLCLGQLMMVLDATIVCPFNDVDAVAAAVASYGEGLAAIEGSDELEAIVADALSANADAAERVREGNAKAIGPIVGYVMRETKGRADGTEVSRLINEQLGV